MNYFVLHYQYLKDGQTVISPTATFDTLDLAKADWHNRMASNMVSENVLGCLTVIHNNVGHIVLNDYWQKEIIPTPVVEETPITEEETPVIEE